MNGVERKKLHLEALGALDVGMAVAVVLSILRAAQAAPGPTGVLLRLGWRLLPGTNTDQVRADTAIALIAGAACGLLAFLAIHVWLSRTSRAPRAAQRIERRQGFRVAAATPVFVYGWSQDEPFAESTQTVNVSEAGGLIPVSVRLSPSQQLILTNLRTEKDIACRVARLATGKNGETLAGLAFLQDSPDFWQIEFVPARARVAELPYQKRRTGLRLSAM